MWGISRKINLGHMCDMARDDHQMRIRLPESLLTSLREHAKTRSRSLNAEIVARLTDTFRTDALVTDNIYGAKLSDLMVRFASLSDLLETLVKRQQGEERQRRRTRPRKPYIRKP